MHLAPEDRQKLPVCCFALDTIKKLLRAKIDRIVGNCERGECALAHVVLAKSLEGLGRPNHGADPFFALEVNFAISVDRRGGVVTANPLSPVLAACLGVETAGYTAIRHHVQRVVDQQRRRRMGTPFEVPQAMWVRVTSPFPVGRIAISLGLS